MTAATTRSDLLDTVSRYYTGRLDEHGPTARGVDWNSVQSQQTRFDQLLRVCDPQWSRTIGDFGCGYGALLSHLRSSIGPGRSRRGQHFYRIRFVRGKIAAAARPASNRRTICTSVVQSATSCCVGFWGPGPKIRFRA